MSRINALTGTKFSTLAIALFGVMGLGAKGCDRAVVGDDGQCKEDCGEAGADSGTAGSGIAGTTGHAGTGTGGRPGTGGESSAGRGGSGTAGKGDGNGGASGSIICGGLAGLKCPDDQYCNYAPDAQCGAADQTGVCAAIPDACPAIDDPVCGCDDTTYSNSCLAAVAGVAVQHDGACEDEGVVCGGFVGEQCAEDEFCDYPAESICGRADGPGVCKPIPDACDAIYAPVCGCDGTTYSSACDANLHGVSVETEGECETDPNGGTCGGLRGAMCAEGMFCNYSLEAMCGAADQTGTCEEIPQGCTKNLDPVCGCDDKTYDNECVANAAGVAVSSRGPCETAPIDFCGGIAGFGCPDGQYCNFPLESMCGDGDMTGKCADIPEGCTTNYDPVCGCDGMTYGNSCDAASAGISVRSEGECRAAE